MCGVWKQKGRLEAVRKGGRILSDPLWSAVRILARVISKQASVDKKMEMEASFLFNQTWSCCVRSPDVQAAEGSDSWGRSKGEADNGAGAGEGCALPGASLGVIVVLLAARCNAQLRGLIQGLEVVQGGELSLSQLV